MDNIEIKNAKYNKRNNSNENSSINCVINNRHLSVPLDPANTDYQAIQEWVAEGNTIAEAD